MALILLKEPSRSSRTATNPTAALYIVVLFLTLAAMTVYLGYQLGVGHSAAASSGSSNFVRFIPPADIETTSSAL